MNRHIWIVEIWIDERQRWEPTVGAALSREDGRKELLRWSENNSFDKFRLRKYVVSR